MINDLIDITQFSVFESMMNYMNKIETVVEYAGYTDYADDLIAEMFDVYLEATDRRKKADEIDKYLVDVGVVDSKAKTPQKARQARQVRNFLMTQDFDPKTRTIKSDYKDKNGKSPRIDLRVNTGFDFSSSDDDNKHVIGLTNKTLKGKAANKAFIVTHEKGHDLFNRDGRHAQWSKGDEDDAANKNERGIKFINKAIDSGKDINDHDSGEYLVNYDRDGHSPEELEADLYAGKTARVRTKYAGSKRAVKRSGATRNLNDTEIEKVYIYFTKLITMPEQDAEVIYKNTLRKIKIYKECIDLSSIIDEIRNKNLNEIDVNKYISIIKNYDKSMKYILGSRTKEIKMYEQLASDLKKLESEIKNYNKSNNQQLEELKEQLELVNTVYSSLENDPDINTNYIYEYINRIYDYLKTIKNGGSSVIPKLPDSEMLRKNVSNLIEKIKDKESKIGTIKKQLSESKKTLRKWLNNNKNIKSDDSTQMRHDFVKQYLHEYFIEFMTEYYSSIFNESI